MHEYYLRITCQDTSYKKKKSRQTEKLIYGILSTDAAHGDPSLVVGQRFRSYEPPTVKMHM